MSKHHSNAAGVFTPWNKGRLIGQKPPLKLKEIWAIRIRLQFAGRLRVNDISHGATVAARAIVMQQKTKRPVQFELTDQTRDSVSKWIAHAGLRADRYLFPSRTVTGAHLSTRQYSRVVAGWISAIGLDPATYGTHSMRRTKASLIYRRTKNLRAVVHDNLRDPGYFASTPTC